ncbi:hypothetical protein [Actinacidiphila acididurans]|uniref:WD40 repeat domain-containing protein n=1 Tax=Actinacidiphila acididurans TaxID=2784346 RepID=A0ABS2U3W6_9ACTN|nr:hypothetical protein [Actinacidiphila acididurans]MBM9509210.1 hypothetical protein [Actinacidiphila acididurans]
MIGSGAVREIPVPKGLGEVADLAPVSRGERPVWLALGADGTISHWDMAAGDHEPVATTGLAAEPDREPWAGHRCRRRLHACGDGTFAAVVNDYGRLGEVIDLRTGRTTLALDNQGGHEETVPFSLAFARHRGRDVVVHRTAWNRLDVSDAQSGALLTARSHAAPADERARPEHFLDYFHGALYVSPDGRRILDDGWLWHPVGFPAVWDLDRWLEIEVWESEDGPSRVDVCGREYYWDHAMTWLGSARVAVEGIGDDEEDMRPGARILDTTRTAQGDLWRVPTAVEVLAFEGPSGRFFSDGIHLFSSGDGDGNISAAGLSAWDPARGELLGVVPGFFPTHHHPGARQFVEIAGDAVRVWTA